MAYSAAVDMLPAYAVTAQYMAACSPGVDNPLCTRTSLLDVTLTAGWGDYGMQEGMDTDATLAWHSQQFEVETIYSTECCTCCPLLMQLMTPAPDHSAACCRGGTAVLLTSGCTG